MRTAQTTWNAVPPVGRAAHASNVPRGVRPEFPLRRPAARGTDAETGSSARWAPPSGGVRDTRRSGACRCARPAVQPRSRETAASRTMTGRAPGAVQPCICGPTPMRDSRWTTDRLHRLAGPASRAQTPTRRDGCGGPYTLVREWCRCFSPSPATPRQTVRVPATPRSSGILSQSPVTHPPPARARPIRAPASIPYPPAPAPAARAAMGDCLPTASGQARARPAARGHRPAASHRPAVWRPAARACDTNGCASTAHHPAFHVRPRMPATNGATDLKAAAVRARGSDPRATPRLTAQEATAKGHRERPCRHACSPACLPRLVARLAVFRTSPLAMGGPSRIFTPNCQRGER